MPLVNEIDGVPTFKFPDAYAPLFYEDKTYFIISGGRGSAKSISVAAYIIIKLFGDEYMRAIIARYTQRSLKNSIFQDVLDLLKAWNLLSHVKIQGDQIINVKNDNMILTHAVRLADGNMTAKNKGLSACTHLFIDEALEISRELDYVMLNDSLRTKGSERKIFIVFNPDSRTHWLHKRFFLPTDEPNPKWLDTHCFLHTTFEDNLENLDPTKVAEWRSMKEIDPVYYETQILGHWRDSGAGQVFTNWKFTYEPDFDSQVMVGLDWGYNDPCAVTLVHKRGSKVWVKEILYESRLSLDEVADRLHRALPARVPIYCDSAEPRSISYLQSKGLNCIAAKKGPDSIIFGIKKIQQYEVFADPSSINLIHEYQNYEWLAGSDKPVDRYNHLLDSFRYALSLEETQHGQYGFSSTKKEQPWEKISIGVNTRMY